MTNRICRAGRAAFAALVAAGLTFGAGSALAAPDARRCPSDPDNGWIGVACTSHQACVDACSEWWGSWNPGLCDNGCCSCAT